MNKEERLAAVRAYREKIKTANIDFVALNERLRNLNNSYDALISQSEVLTKWRNDAIEKIDSLPSITRATVKKLLGLD